MNSIINVLIIFLYTLSFLFPLYIFSSLAIRIFVDKRFDNKLGIKTMGLREMNGEKLYNRTESTPYLALRKFAKEYKLPKDSQMVDFGAGKGRVSIYLGDKLSIPVKGIEVNEKTYAELVENISIVKRHSQISVKAIFEYAEEYIPEENDNIFFFFNPFHKEIFELVLNNIAKDSLVNNKTVDVVLYYPLGGFIKLLESSGFKKISQYRYVGAISPREKFVVYRLNGKD